MSILGRLLEAREISPLSYYFAEFVSEAAGQNLDSLLAYSAALVSEASQQGHVCVRLDHFSGVALFESDRVGSSEIPSGPASNDWCNELREFSPVGAPGDTSPLILENDRLYLHRYWHYETTVADSIQSRLKKDNEIEMTKLVAELDSLYPSKGDGKFNEQKLAVALSLKRRFMVISGGPGTGKTTTVINILWVLLSQNPGLRIQLAAPTGKAAARLMESIRLSLEHSQPDEAIAELLPTQASTIHRLLGYRHNGFYYSRQQRLPLDCVVIDEASMIDLTLMYRLLEALPADARIILLGDRDQLASVAAGNVLSDITGQGQAISYSEQQIEWLNTLFEQTVDSQQQTAIADTVMADSVALLTHSYRFEAQNSIGKLAQLVNIGDSAAVIGLLQQVDNPLRWHNQQSNVLDGAILDTILMRYQTVVSAESVVAAFDAFESNRVLCGVHSGPFGVDEINRRINESMHARGWIEAQVDYHGKPLLIHSNDYDLGLFNGDIGLLWREADNNLYAYFRNIDHGLSRFPVTSLPAHSSAWAMTVHKSQGSEFESIFLVLPGQNQSRALSRELLYTGITRARQHLSIYATATAIETACHKRNQRHSGLSAKLGWQDNHG